ncbi:NAD-dependent epimerase/dehydratase family protein [Cytobacillus firmus]|uniref:NAD-dependent epimerase/dehydratase family protein n=1 Tax=Cytobacillus firmus TaxID=1399 RepID=UPI00368B6CF9
MKKVVITGGAGFIGSNLAKKLVEIGYKVFIIDDLFSGSLDNLKGLNIEFIQGTILNKNLLLKVFKGSDIVFHLAARNIIAAIENPREDLRSNIEGTYNVLEAAKDAKVNKLVYASTSSIYGNPKYLPINEDDKLNFLNFYSVSKFAGESYAKVFYEVYGLPITVVRYSNVFGYNQRAENPYCGVIGKFIDYCNYKKPILIHGDGEQTRDFTFIDDAVEATILSGLSNKSIGESYNIGTGVETSINSLAFKLKKITNSESEVKYIEKRDIDNLRRRVMNIEKIRYQLKFFPKYTLGEGLKKTVEWYQDNNKLSSF